MDSAIKNGGDFGPEFPFKRQLTAYLETHQLLPDSQFAYRKQHLTEDALVLAVNRWSTATCKREFTGTVFVDMSKAFDRVTHERLVTVLFSLGIAGTALEWFTDYYSNKNCFMAVF